MTDTTNYEGTDAFFDEINYASHEEVPECLPRDQWGRPLLIGLDGKRRPYTRCSTLSGYIENKRGLHIWDVRRIARGMGLREDVAAMAASLPAWTGDKAKDEITNKALDEYVELARDAAREHQDANWGTAVHGFTENGQQGNPYVPQRMQADVDSYWRWVEEARIEILATEIFVVCEALGVAGTFDDLYGTYGYGPIVGDKKTGKAKIHSHAIQKAVYANSEVYDLETGERRPLSSLYAGTRYEKYPVNLNHALWVHIPAGEGVTRVGALDIRAGWEAAKHAAAARDYQKLRGEPFVTMVNEQMYADADRQRVWDAIGDATSREELVGIASTYRHVWQDSMTAAGTRRLQELGLR